MSWLKKGPLLGLLGGALVCWLLVVLFFDPVLKRSLERAGGAANGAKVEIGSLRTKWLSGTLEMTRLQAADRDEPMKNSVEAARAGFRLDTSALVRGKFVIREAAIEGLRFGTPRRTSGALPEVPPSALEKAVMDRIAPVKGATLAQASAVKDNAATEIDAAKLQGLKKLDEAKAKTKEIEARWAAKAEEAKALEAEVKALAEEAKALSAGGSSPADILKKAAEGKRIADKAKALQARVEASREQAKKDLAEAQALVRQADELRKKDLNGLLAEAGLPTLDSQDLARRLLGERSAARLATAMRWMRLAREKAAARKAAVPPKPARGAGIDVEFPREHSYPQFLLEGAKLSGSLDAAPGGAADLSGLLNGVTSNPALYGKPATLDLAGRSAAGLSLKLSGRLDQQADPVGVTVTFEGAGFPLAGGTLGDGEIGGALTAGTARARGTLALVGEEWKGEIAVDATGVSVEPKVALSGAAGQMASSALKSMNAFTVRIGVSGREDDLKLSFSSNAGELLAGAMKKAFAGQLEGRRKELEGKLAALYGGRSAEAGAAADGLSGKILSPLDSQKAALDRALKDALGQGGKSPIPFKLFK